MKKTNYDYTKVGPLREGFEYQDAQAIQYFLSWLEKPRFYKWIIVEADKFGYLDDIVISYSDGLIELVQVKYSIHPESPEKKWSWTHLTKKDKNKISLFNKWFYSWQEIKIHQKNLKVIIKTNKQANGILKRTLLASVDGYYKVNIKELKKTKFYNQLIKEIKESDIKRFLEELRFSFESDLNDLWKFNEKRFKNNLGGTSEGWSSLKKYARDWTLKKNIPSEDGKIYLSHIHKAALWFQPKHLDQNFPIPNDFVLFNSKLFKDLCDEFTKKTGGIKIFYGSPGIGKSTFLNFLAKYLESTKKLPTIVYNYYVPSEDQFYERLRFQKAVEGMKFKFLHIPLLRKSLANLASQNLENVSLKEIIRQSSKYFKKIGKHLIVVIDGLDHVLNYANIKELEDFLKEFLPLKEGLWLLIGTQLSVMKSLPQLLLNSCLGDQRIEIRGLSFKGVEHIIKSNKNTLKIRKNQSSFIIKKLYEISEGNPLYLRYCINYLHNLNLKELYPVHIDSIPPYGGNIQNYYQVLWHNLNYEAKEIAILLSSIEVNLTKGHILKIVAKKDLEFKEVVASFSAINHLLAFRRGRVRIFHLSFVNFIRDSDDYFIIEKAVKNKFLSWIQSIEAPDEIKWAYSGILEYEVGNYKKFIKSLNRSWLNKSVIENHPLDLILYQLRLGAYCCFKKGLYSKGLQLGLLLTYAENAPNEVQEAWNKIWSMQFQKNAKEIDFDLKDLKQLSSNQLEIIAEKSWEFGETDILEIIFDELNLRLGDRHTTSDHLQIAMSTVVGFLKFDYKEILKWAAQFEGHEKHKILRNYCDVLLKTNQETVLNRIIRDKDTVKADKAVVLTNISKYQLKLNASIAWLKKDSSPDLWKSWTLLYLVLSKSLNGKEDLKIKISNPKDFPISIKDYGDDRYIFENKYLNLFFNSLVSQILFDDIKIEEKIQLCDARYSHQVYQKLVQLSRILAKNYKEKQLFKYEEILNIFSDLYLPQWAQDREIITFFYALKRVFGSIFMAIHILNSYQTISFINTNQLKKFNRFSLFDYSDFVSFIIDERIKILDENACNYLLDTLEKEIDSEITGFPERARKYADLAEVAKLYKNNKYYSKFVNKSVSNFFCHGYHKDIFLFGVLESLLACHIAGSSEAKKWIEHIIPMISEVSNYTDGDETNHLPPKLSETLAVTNIDLIRNYYLEEAKNEDFFLAEKIFPNLINSIDLNNPAAKALATTGVDAASINILKDKSNKGDQGAKNIIKNNQAYFGELSVLEIDHSNSEEKSTEDEANGIDVRKILPKKLSLELKTIDQFKRKKFLYTWIDYWLQNPTTREDNYMIIKQIVLSNSEYIREYDLIDKLLPYIREFESSDFLFSFVCNYYIAIFGWSYYWTPKKYIVNIWKILKENFPNRREEFLLKTIGKDPFKKIDNFKYFLPIPRIVEYFIYFNDLNTAENLVEEIVKSTEILMGNLNLKIPSWMKITPPDLYELLLSRLEWPSPIIRERSANAIAKLLESDTDDLIFNKLIDWISSQQLESTVILGLLPIAKYARRNKNQFGLKTEDIIKAIKKPSIVSTKLLQELTKNINIASFENGYLEKHPDNYKIDDFFIKYVESFIPTWFWNKAKKVEKEYFVNFVAQWSWEFENIINDLNIKKISEIYYQGYRHQPKLVGFSSRISEVYKSSYLRTLAYYFKEHKIPDWLYYNQSFEVCPIDLALWEIAPKTAPKWWLKYSDTTSKDDFDVNTSSAITLLDELINEQCLNNNSKMLLLAANGPIEPMEGWIQNKIISDFTILGFAYKTLGPNIPRDKDIIDALKWKSIWVSNPYVDKPFSFLNNPHRSTYLPKEMKWNIQDLEIIPLTALIRTNTINLWQWHRFYPFIGLFGLSNFLYSQKVKYNKQKFSWNYLTSNTRTNIAKGNLWSMGIIERTDDERSIPAGHFLQISRNWLDSILKEKKLRLGITSELRFVIKKYSYEKPNIYKVYKSYGISPLIL